MGVCVHPGAGRRCLVMAGRLDGAVECVDGGGRPLVCPAGELPPVRHPGFDRAVRATATRRPSGQ